MPDFTVHIVDGNAEEHLFSLPGPNAEAVTRDAWDMIARDAVEPDEMPGPNEDGYEDACSEIDSDVSTFIDDIIWTAVWEGDHSQIPATAPVYTVGDEPAVPAVGSVITVLGKPVTIKPAAGLPEHMRGHYTVLGEPAERSDMIRAWRSIPDKGVRIVSPVYA